MEKGPPEPRDSGRWVATLAGVVFSTHATPERQPSAAKSRAADAQRCGILATSDGDEK